MIIEKYLENWKNKETNIPIIIFIGGYAGTGKSTLADKMKSDVFPMASVFTTGLLREISKEYIELTEAPSLYKSTYRLHELLSNVDSIGKVIDLFKDQRRITQNLLPRIIDFCVQEKQIAIINGNHIDSKIVETISKKYSNKIYTVKVYLKTTDRKTHKKMIEGSTHSRVLSEKDLDTARYLQNFLIEEAIVDNVAVFEFNEKFDYILADIDRQLAIQIT